MWIYISYNDQIINAYEIDEINVLKPIYISYNDQIINFNILDEILDSNKIFTFHIMIRL